jgi:hypothetical protein
MCWGLVTCDEGAEESVEIVKLLSGTRVGPNIEVDWKRSKEIIELLSALICSV